jgi:hypothetical protein
MIGAAMPIVAYPGRHPTRNVARPMVSRVMIRFRLRPIRSPRYPKISPPTGRAKNATEYVASAASVPATGETLGKKTRLNTSADAVP